MHLRDRLPPAWTVSRTNLPLAITDGMRRPVSYGMLYAPKLSTRSKRTRFR